MEMQRVRFPFVFYLIKIRSLVGIGGAILGCIGWIKTSVEELMKFINNFGIIIFLIIGITIIIEIIGVERNSVVELAIYKEKIGYKLWPWGKERQKEYKEIISVKKYPEERGKNFFDFFKSFCLTHFISQYEQPKSFQAVRWVPVIEIVFKDKKRIYIYPSFTQYYFYPKLGHFDYSWFISYLNEKINMGFK
jgi:hypothetical protein